MTTPPIPSGQVSACCVHIWERQMGNVFLCKKCNRTQVSYLGDEYRTPPAGLLDKMFAEVDPSIKVVDATPSTGYAVIAPESVDKFKKATKEVSEQVGAVGKALSEREKLDDPETIRKTVEMANEMQREIDRGIFKSSSELIEENYMLKKRVKELEGMYLCQGDLNNAQTLKILELEEKFKKESKLCAIACDDALSSTEE